jgi:hypothetical protein
LSIQGVEVKNFDVKIVTGVRNRLRPHSIFFLPSLIPQN